MFTLLHENTFCCGYGARISFPQNCQAPDIFHMWHILYPEIMLCLILLVTCSVICSFFYGIYDYTAVQILLNQDRTIIVTCDNYGKTWTLESEVIII